MMMYHFDNLLKKFRKTIFTITPLEVIANNARRTREREKISIAVDGLKRIIQKSITKEWNPEVDKITTEIIVEAENTLRELEN